MAGGGGRAASATLFFFWLWCVCTLYARYIAGFIFVISLAFPCVPLSFSLSFYFVVLTHLPLMKSVDVILDDTHPPHDVYRHYAL